MSLSKEVDSILRDAVSKGHVPGVVAAVTDRDDTIYEGGLGERVLGGGEAMTPDTVVWIASMTKAITGVAAMQLVEQGELELDEPVARWAPPLGEVEVLTGFGDDGVPITRPPARPVTLRHLLTHTAGYAYELWNPAIVRYQEALGLPALISCENAALETPLVFDPGERWEYGIGIDWVGKIVEAVSGRRLGSYLRENVFEPLGMRDTAFRVTSAMRSRLAKVHQRGDDGALSPLDLEMPQEPEFESGGAGLYSTAGDYLELVRLMLNAGEAHGEQILARETVAMMSRNQMGDCRVCRLETVMPHLTKDAEFFPGMPKSWGLTFMINEEDAPTGRSAGSLAWAGLANSYYWIDQKKGIGGVYLTQILPFGDERSLPLYYAFETAVYESLA